MDRSLPSGGIPYPSFPSFSPDVQGMEPPSSRRVVVVVMVASRASRAPVAQPVITI